MNFVVQNFYSTATQTKDLKFDNEYSRLIGAIGKDALKRLQSAKVLLVGLNGLGLEIGAFSQFVLFLRPSLVTSRPNICLLMSPYS